MALMVMGIAACHCIHGTTDKGLEKEEAMRSLKNKDKSTKLPARHQTQCFPITLIQTAILHAASTENLKLPTKKAKGGTAE